MPPKKCPDARASAAFVGQVQRGRDGQLWTAVPNAKRSGGFQWKACKSDSTSAPSHVSATFMPTFFVAPKPAAKQTKPRAALKLAEFFSPAAPASGFVHTTATEKAQAKRERASKTTQRMSVEKLQSRRTSRPFAAGGAVSDAKDARPASSSAFISSPAPVVLHAAQFFDFRTTTSAPPPPPPPQQQSSSRHKLAVAADDPMEVEITNQ